MAATTTHYPALVAREPAEGRGWLIEADTPEGEAQLAYDGDMRHALAHLLCAAPDLLAALEETLRALEQHLDDDTNAHGLKHRDILCPCNANEVVRARAAISRAKGGAS